jgi:hypothetical protein
MVTAIRDHLAVAKNEFSVAAIIHDRRRKRPPSARPQSRRPGATPRECDDPRSAENCDAAEGKKNRRGHDTCRTKRNPRPVQRPS